MSDYSTLKDQIITLLNASLSVPVLDIIQVNEAQLERMPSFVCVRLESVDYEPHPHINPQTASAQQESLWRWSIYVMGGGGRTKPAGKTEEVMTLIDTVRSSLNAQRLDSVSGPMRLVRLEFENKVANTHAVMYRMDFEHSRDD